MVYISEKSVEAYKRKSYLRFIVPLTVYFLSQIAQAQILLKSDPAYYTLPNIFIAIILLISIISVVPLVMKYRIFTMIPVICAGFVDVACWVIMIYEDYENNMGGRLNLKLA